MVHRSLVLRKGKLLQEDFYVLDTAMSATEGLKWLSKFKLAFWLKHYRWTRNVLWNVHTELFVIFQGKPFFYADAIGKLKTETYFNVRYFQLKSEWTTLVYE